MTEKAYFIEFRVAEGCITNTIVGRDFVPCALEDEWETFMALGSNKNECLSEMIAKLESLKD